MSKITDMIISAIIKKGVLGEARNVDVEFDIPGDQPSAANRIHLKVDHLSVKMDKGTSCERGVS